MTQWLAGQGDDKAGSSQLIKSTSDEHILKKFFNSLLHIISYSKLYPQKIAW